MLCSYHSRYQALTELRIMAFFYKYLPTAKWSGQAELTPGLFFQLFVHTFASITALKNEKDNHYN